MSKEKVVGFSSGWPMLGLVVILFLGSIFLIVSSARADSPPGGILGVVVLLVSLLLLAGLFVVQPNQAKVLTLFGKYVGTAKANGFFYANPFAKKIDVSLRARTLNGEKLKVNDLAGNPIEIAAVVVWRVHDTAEAVFDVDDYPYYVETQSETAVRKLASAFPYDGPEDRITLRHAADEVNHQLQTELQERLEMAGVEVIEARLSHLAYAPEIAGAMLQRQQAQAVVDARQTIVEGAVGMVEHALEEIEAKDVIDLDNERKAAMISNLLVVLCSDHSPHPVINTGSLYS